MKFRPNARLIVALVALAIAGTIEVLRENSPTFLRPGLRLYAYVANSADGTVTVVDLVKLQPVATIPVGPQPGWVTAMPERKQVWGLSTGGGYVWVINAPKGSVQRIPVCQDPVSLAFSPNKQRAYVACAASGTVAAIDCETRQVAVRGRAGPTSGETVLTVTPNGKWVLVANRVDSSVSVLDATTLREKAALAVAPDPNAIVVLPNSFKAFVGSATTDFVTVLRLDPPAVVTRLEMGGRTSALLLKPDGGEIYALSPDTHGMTVIDTWTNEVGDFLQLGADPAAGVVTRDGATLYACDAGGQRVDVVNLTYRELEGSAPTGQHPVACVLGLDQKLLLVADRASNDLAVIARQGPNLVTLVPVGKQPDSLAVELF